MPQVPVVRFITYHRKSIKEKFDAIVLGYGYFQDGISHRYLAKYVYTARGRKICLYAGYLKCVEGIPQIYTGGSTSLVIRPDTEADELVNKQIQVAGPLRHAIQFVFPEIADGRMRHIMLADQ